MAEPLYRIEEQPVSVPEVPKANPKINKLLYIAILFIFVALAFSGIYIFLTKSEPIPTKLTSEINPTPNSKAIISTVLPTPTSALANNNVGITSAPLVISPTVTPSIVKTARLYFTKQQDTSGRNVIKLMLDSADSPISFFHVKMQFDTSYFQLLQDPVVTDTLKTVIRKSAKDEANTSGTIDISLGLAAQDFTNAPKGIIEAVTLYPTIADAKFTITKENIDIVSIIDPKKGTIVPLQVSVE